MKWLNSSEPIGVRIFAFAVIEGVFFSGSFCSIFWIKEKNILNGLCQANELISRDEALHCEFAKNLFQYVVNKPSEEILVQILKEAVEIEINFITEALSCSLIGMNKNLMSQYIKYVADRVLVDFNCKKIYNVDCPFSFMNNMSVDRKTNFFEKKPTQYMTPLDNDNIDFSKEL